LSTLSEKLLEELNGGAGSVPGFANSPNVKILSGDFDGDGSSDVALTGPAGWTTVPVALSNRNGTFTQANFPGQAVANFASWATWSGARAVSGDVTGDGLDDITLTSASGFGSLPSLISAGSGSFDRTHNTELSGFPGWAALPNMKSVPGDFNGDGLRHGGVGEGARCHAHAHDLNVEVKGGGFTAVVSNAWRGP
jgi:VCBS repeat protein